MPEVELPNPHELNEIKEKRFTRRVALVTAIFAAVLALAALGKNYTMKEMLLTQQEASNQWSFYQAKVIREHLYRSQAMLLEASLHDRIGSMKPEARERIEGHLKKVGSGFLIPMLKDSDDELRWEVAKVLAETADPERRLIS